MPTPTEGEVLLPPLVPRRRPRMASFTIYRGEPIRLDVTAFHHFISGSLDDLSAAGVSVQARVFSDFRDAGTLISTKTVENGGIVFPGGGNKGRIEIQLVPEDVAEERPIYVVIYANGRIIDLFGNEIQPAPRP